MRPGAEYPMAHGPVASAAAARSPWQSPVPYLFGELAAMLGLIALSLLALACSHWKFSGGLGPDDDQAAGPGAEKGVGADRIAGERRRHVVVIMAGDEVPTFLATPASASVDGELAAGVTAFRAARASEEGKMVGCETSSARLAGSEDDDAEADRE